MKETRTKEEKENGNEITTRNINPKMVESLILRNLHQIKEGKSRGGSNAGTRR